MQYLYGSRCDEALTAFERQYHKYLIHNLSLHPQQILWHVQLSGILDPTLYVGRERDAAFLAVVPLIIVRFDDTAPSDKRYRKLARIIHAGLYHDTHDSVRILLKKQGIATSLLSPALPPTRNPLINLVDTSANRNQGARIINPAEHNTKIEFENNLKAHLRSQYFDHRKSFPEVLARISQKTEEYAVLCDLLYNSEQPLVPLERLFHIETLIQKTQMEILNDTGNPYDGYFFLHEFAPSRLLKEKKPPATCYSKLSKYWVKFIERQANDNTSQLLSEVGQSALPKANPRFYEKVVAQERRRIHRDLLASKDLNEHARKSPIDILVLDPDARPLIAIEFDGKDHQKSDQQTKDRLKNIGLELLHVPCIRIESKYRPPPDDDRGVRVSQFDRQKRKEASDHERLCAFIFSYFVERQHRIRQSRSYSTEDPISDFSELLNETGSDPQYLSEFRKQLEKMNFSDPLDQESVRIDSSRFSQLPDDEQRKIAVDSFQLSYELWSHAGDDSGLFQEILSVSQYRIKYLRKAYGEHSLQFETEMSGPNSKFTGTLIISDNSGRVVDRSELTINAIPGNWTARRFMPLLDAGYSSRYFYGAFLFHELVNTAYERMIRKFSRKQPQP